MKKFILILGGVRSGKSRYAIKLAKDLSRPPSLKLRGTALRSLGEGGRKVAYVATCTNPDMEMKKRIKLHKKSRPRHWKVIEEGKEVSSILNSLKNESDVVIIDCLGLLVANLLSENLKDSQILKSLKELTKSITKSRATTILVSNEVGSGIVPENLLARRFRDWLGLANQTLAKKADEVILMQSGIPLKIKNLKEK